MNKSPLQKRKQTYHSGMRKNTISSIRSNWLNRSPTRDQAHNGGITPNKQRYKLVAVDQEMSDNKCFPDQGPARATEGGDATKRKVEAGQVTTAKTNEQSKP